MQYRKTVLSACLLPVLLAAGCGSGNHSAQNGSPLSQSSSEKGENKMPTQSPMLNEIFVSEKYIRPGRSKDVSYIVSKYLPIGSSREEVIKKLNEMNQYYQDEGNIIYAGYGEKTHPMIPNPEVMISLKFNDSGYLENIDSKFYYAQ